ncbi:MAG TPA: cysteine rich repeat-containing protein [Candidatus Margulisiibacteriota bacterium]|nr:cysteine rich repeat-containing protein [Candidatus Margulisiibacteriota bacterium]
MRRLLISSSVVAILLLVTGGAQAEENLVEGIKKACHKELTTFCKGVQPGEGRVLACLYAFQDRVSGKCEYAVYDAAAQLEQAAMALKFAAAECKDDLLKYCGDVEVGNGRVKACLDKHEKALSEKCKDALKQTGIKP